MRRWVSGWDLYLVSGCGEGGRAYGGLACIVEAEEEQLSVLVCQAELGEHVPDYTVVYRSACVLLLWLGIPSCFRYAPAAGLQAEEGTYTSQEST